MNAANSLPDLSINLAFDAYCAQRNELTAHENRYDPMMPCKNWRHNPKQDYFGTGLSPVERLQHSHETPTLDYIETIISPIKQHTQICNPARELFNYLEGDSALVNLVADLLQETSKTRFCQVIKWVCELVKHSTNEDALRCILLLLKNEKIATVIGEIENGNPEVLSALFESLQRDNSRPQTRSQTSGSTAANATIEVNITIAIARLITQANICDKIASMSNGEIVEQFLSKCFFLLNKHSACKTSQDKEIIRDLTIAIARLITQANICDKIASMSDRAIQTFLISVPKLLNYIRSNMCDTVDLARTISQSIVIAIANLTVNENILSIISSLTDRKIKQLFIICCVELQRSRDAGLNSISYNMASAILRFVAHKKIFCKVSTMLSRQVAQVFDLFCSSLMQDDIKKTNSVILYNIVHDIAATINLLTDNTNICKQIFSMSDVKISNLFMTLNILALHYIQKQDNQIVEISREIVSDIIATIGRLTTNQNISRKKCQLLMLHFIRHHVRCLVHHCSSVVNTLFQVKIWAKMNTQRRLD